MGKCSDNFRHWMGRTTIIRPTHQRSSGAWVWMCSFIYGTKKSFSLFNVKAGNASYSIKVIHVDCLSAWLRKEASKEELYLLLTEITWWRHQMETFSVLLAICAGNSPVIGEVPTQKPVTRSFDVFFNLRLNNRLSKHSWGWWFEMPSHPLWRDCNELRLGLE